MEANASVEKLLKEGQVVQFHPIGGSMYPLFVDKDDYAIVEPMNGRTPKKGDVLVYRNLSGILVIHRVYKVRGNELYMIGDRQVIPEGPLSINCALGIMSGYIRKGKTHGVKSILYKIYSFLWMEIRIIMGHVLKFFWKMKG